MVKKPPDHKTRDKIANELDASFFVEAGAGSGKTRSLVDRMAGLVCSGRAHIENIAAVTFTRKAAAELRERIQIKLEDILHDKKTSPKERDTIFESLSAFERSSISTIHSFCARILRERPVEAGIDPGFEEVEEEDNDILAGRIWAEYIERQGFENNKAIGWMRENGIGPDALDKIYLKLVGHSDVEVRRDDVPKPDFTTQKKDIKRFIEQLGKKLPPEEPASGWGPLQKTIRRCLKLFKMGFLKNDRLFVELLNILDKDPKVTQNRWPKKDGKDRLDEMKAFRESVVTPALQAWGEYIHKPLIDFALEGARYFDAWRRERSILNFQDLLMRTAKLLRENAEVRSYFKKRIQYLLVDEFQDTDPIQAEIVMLLTGEDSAVSDWRKVRPVKGALFLVGDPKQSIYRFRRADIDIFNQVKGIFKTGAGEVLELTSNFRSLDPIREITNAVFEGEFPKDETVHQAKFAPLVTVRGNDNSFDSGVFENETGKVAGNKPKTIAEQDARKIASWIYGAINGALRLERSDDEKDSGKTESAGPGDFMIIAKTKKHLPVYAKALETLGIPYEISGGENFSASEELREICKVLKATADPRDPAALVAALRGLFFGVSDNDLYIFAKAGGRFSYFSKTEKGPDSVIRAFARLREYNEIAERFTPVTAIEMIIEKLGIVPFAVSGEIGATRAGNILKAVELLRERKFDGIGSFAELVDYLRDLRDIKGIEAMNLFPGASISVRIMNLHKAKGLEAPVVFLVDPLGALGGYDPTQYIKRTGDNSVGYFCIEKELNEFKTEPIATPLEWGACALEEAQYEAAEEKRLDYVAVTRARNMLVVSTYREGAKKKGWELLYPYLSEMPKLSVEKFIEPQAKKTVPVTESEWEKEMTKIEEALRGLGKESYHRSGVAEMVESPEIFTGGTDRGMEWGSIVHKALELCGKGKRNDLETLARNWLVEKDRSPDEYAELTRLVDGIMKSDLWQRMLKGEEKYFELPFSVMKEDTVIRGVIDMIFKENDAWVIVDYKTDDFDKFPERKKAYNNQLAMYAELWTKMTGEKVKETTLCKVA
ncbi:MAG: UvrD-helicase domain-containing protein [Candidatus Omnitrophota bacterium]